MSAFLSSTSNYSLYSIPAVWVVSISAHFYAISLYGKNGDWDNSQPRATVAGLSTKANRTALESKILRAESAQQNGFENIGLYAAAILAGNWAKLPVSTLNSIAAGYVASRIVYNYLYINGPDGFTSNLRTASFLGGIGMIFTLFIKAANTIY